MVSPPKGSSGKCAHSLSSLHTTLDVETTTPKFSATAKRRDGGREGESTSEEKEKRDRSGRSSPSNMKTRHILLNSKSNLLCCLLEVDYYYFHCFHWYLSGQSVALMDPSTGQDPSKICFNINMCIRYPSSQLILRDFTRIYYLELTKLTRQINQFSCWW